MKTLPLILFSLLFCAMFWAGPWDGAENFDASWAGQTQSGEAPGREAMKEFYKEQCRSCHGATGKGDGPLTRILTAPVGDLTDPKMWEKTDEEIFGIICRGKEPMPAYRSSLGEEGCRAMVDYVRTFAPEP